MKTKLCNKCDIEKPITDFYKQTNKECRFAECKKCNNERSRLYKQKNKDEILKQRINYRNSEYGKGVNKEYYKNNKEKILKKESVRRKTKEYKRYHSKWMTKWTKERKKHDIHFRNKCLLNTTLWRQLIKYKKTKKNRTLKYIGCDLDFFVKHLESNFTDGMNWDNQGRGGWHIGHIKPCEIFNLEEDDEIFKSFHYSNLKPQWEIENISENDKLPDGQLARYIPENKKKEVRIYLYGKDIEIK